MKKLFLILIGIILCGCSLEVKDQYENYEHYNLNDRNLIIHKYFDEENEKEDVYVIGEFVPINKNDSVSGVFYRVSKDDYILLDIFGQDYNASESYVRFYENKLYFLGSYEYTFSKEKFTKKEKVFSYPYENFYVTSIFDLHDGYIFFKGNILGEYNDKDIKIKCSLTNYECERIYTN